MEKVKRKSTQRLNIVKRLATTQWGADKKTLRQLYIGYVRSTMEYNLPLQSISSDTTQTSLDKVESSAVHFIAGAMRSASTAACHIHTNIQPLGLRREAAVIEMTERYRRQEDHMPNARIVQDWKENSRIQKRSILKVEKQLQEKHHLPENRKIESFVEKCPQPGLNIKTPLIKLNLKENLSKKGADLIQLQMTGLQTIQEYPENCTHVYTDGSAFKGTVNAGYGARLEFPDKSLEEIADPCGANCSNFEAEALAIIAALNKIEEKFDENPNLLSKTVIFTDAKSVIQSLDSDRPKANVIQDLSKVLDSFISKFEQEVIIQWIPSHCQIDGNERADALAKKGASKEQPERPVSQETCRQIIRNNTQIEWLSQWALGTKGRAVFTHMAAPTQTDPIDNLGRRDQSIIFRLRSRHVALNMHLNWLDPMQGAAFPLCPCPYKTVQHLLFECPELSELR